MTPKPATPMIKLAELRAWLLAEGIKGHTIKALIEGGTIPRKIFPGRTYAYYEVAKVAAALSIADPLSNHQPNHTTHAH